MAAAELWDDVRANLYDVLGVRSSASDAVIQQAWRRRARQVHPDAGGGDAEFQTVHIAYLVLSDAEQRRRYDNQLASGSDRRSVSKDEFLAAEADSVTFPDATVRESVPEPPSSPRVLWLMALIGCFAIVMAYLVPWTTLVTGLVVGVFVMGRYVRMWRARL